MTNQELGQQGEALAAQFLLSRGYQLLAQNWRQPPAEADLVLFDRSTNQLIIVEVKSSRRGLDLLDPADGDEALLRRLTVQKWRQLNHSGRQALVKWQQVRYRLDLVTVELSLDQSPVIKHYPDCSTFFQA
ncbi:MAG: hypothetical protein CEO22_486 [Candidatus Berkelbacteria bacterium Gr01-1014_85]|uniref:Uncharacterized protein n=1 Tax=Candidatus Berkelbacteria bacterium Gr01-1014_85 TaxID=2017150 RepID=A0A554JAN3_9BACT|nr:MAG: hypothetical protein CEO22_486 [Candidatus Berkelbacteria bacterium Gr01-1014_85]